MSLSLKLKVDKKRNRISIKDPTPNLTKLEEYAEDKRRIYPKLSSALVRLRQFVGANEVKETVAKQAQFIIMNQMSKRPQRRSTRKRRKTGRLQIGRNTLRGGKRPRLDTDEFDDEEFDPSFPDDIPDGF